MACGVVESGTVGRNTLAPELDVELDGARETELEEALEEKLEAAGSGTTLGAGTTAWAAPNRQLEANRLNEMRQA